MIRWLVEINANQPSHNTALGFTDSLMTNSPGLSQQSELILITFQLQLFSISLQRSRYWQTEHERIDYTDALAMEIETHLVMWSLCRWIHVFSPMARTVMFKDSELWRDTGSKPKNSGVSARTVNLETPLRYRLDS